MQLTEAPSGREEHGGSLAQRRRLRSLLLKRDSSKPLVSRALLVSVSVVLNLKRWKNGNGTYASYRKFLELWARGQMPDASTEMDQHSIPGSPSDGSDLNGSSSIHAATTAKSERNSLLSMGVSQPADSTPAGHLSALTLKDMELVVEASDTPISIVKFARHSSDLLAMGDEAGIVRIIRLAAGTKVIQILEHNAGVSDLDWSITNTAILTCCEDGMIVLWGCGAHEWSCLRTLEIPGSATCCRFHPANENFFIVGSALGSIYSINSSTGAVAADFGLKTSSREGVFASSLECSETLAFVGDSRGHLVVLDANLVSSPKGPPLTLIKRMQPPTRDRVPVLSVQHMPPTDVPGESTLLTYQADGCACLWGVVSSRGRTPRIVRKLKAMIPLPSQYSNAVFCTVGQTAKCTESIALGGLYPGVTIYNLGRINSQQQPAAIIQLQGHLSPVVAVSWSKNRQILAAGDTEGALILWRSGF